MQNSALKAYEKVNKAVMSPRQMEASVLNRAALKLKAVQDTWDEENLEERLDDALRYNQRLWSVFQVDLAAEDNPLPKKLREDILTLSVFIDRRSFDLMAVPERDKLSVLININQNIAAGLNSSTEKKADPA